ncbi:hypothetical protein NPJ88_000355 [Halomonas elongata]|uniref:hypothetical protein n=1 Tax=Halomonas elongata TaxID=2746 RepID=UPI00255A792E|nr:hypothetical protein [Halomonas elongata]MDL4860774.1 hypothetical protein [Halomonas elongata]
MDQLHIDAFQKLVKRQATPAEAARLEQVRETLGVSQDDAIWLIFLGLEYYLSLYSAQSNTIENRVERSVREAIQEIEIPQPPALKPKVTTLVYSGLVIGLSASVPFFVFQYLSNLF